MRKHVIVTGHVQGVFYRNWFVEQMGALGIVGWVRNRRDGSVEAIIEGPPRAIALAIATAREGSPASRVDDVIISDVIAEDIFHGFEKRVTS